MPRIVTTQISFGPLFTFFWVKIGLTPSYTRKCIVLLGINFSKKYYFNIGIVYFHEKVQYLEDNVPNRTCFLFFPSGKAYKNESFMKGYNSILKDYFYYIIMYCSFSIVTSTPVNSLCLNNHPIDNQSDYISEDELTFS